MSAKTGVEKRDDVCEFEFVDEARVNLVRKLMPDAKAVEGLSDIFKVLGDPTRLRIISALATRELCVCDIANLLGTSVSAVSHQLRVLRISKLVKHRKEGKMVYYSLDDDCVETLLREGLKHIEQ